MKEEKLRATPAARSLAHRMGIELSKVVGSGYKGRIHEEDVANFTYEKRGGATPLARKVAEAFGIDINTVEGTGPRGKVKKRDVTKLVENYSDPCLEKIDSYFVKTVPAFAPKTEAKAAPAAAAPKAAAAPNPVVKPQVQGEVIAPDNGLKVPYGEVERQPMNMMRRVIAKRMSDSFFSAPTFVLNYEVDMTEMNVLRAKLIEPIKAKTGKKLTVTDMISLAVARTLMNHPYMNASLSADGNEIEFHNYVNLAMAVGMDEGLLVPVVHGADQMSLTQIMLKLKDLGERAVGKKLTPQDQEGSTFTISNLGMYGVESFTSIINQPNSAILSIAGTKKMPVERNGEVVIRPVMKMSLTSDHRVINGLAAAKFMQELKALIEEPLTLLV